MKRYFSTTRNSIISLSFLAIILLVCVVFLYWKFIEGKQLMPFALVLMCFVFGFFITILVASLLLVKRMEQELRLCEEFIKQLEQGNVGEELNADSTFSASLARSLSLFSLVKASHMRKLHQISSLLDELSSTHRKDGKEETAKLLEEASTTIKDCAKTPFVEG